MAWYGLDTEFQVKKRELFVCAESAETVPDRLHCAALIVVNTVLVPVRTCSICFHLSRVWSLGLVAKQYFISLFCFCGIGTAVGPVLHWIADAVQCPSAVTPVYRPLT